MKKKDLQSDGWVDYELLDSGGKRKLERFGNYHIVRFEKEAIWKPSIPESSWKNVDAEFTFPRGERDGAWQFFSGKPKSWSINVDGLTINLQISESRHIGIFPEQLENWRWVEKCIADSGNNPKVLNLFGYTGVASLFAARGGASVTHVDASRKAIELGKRSLTASDLGEKPVRWLVDDASKFIEKEIRRGNTYDGIIMDPPKFGRGPDGEIWKFDTSILNLFRLCKKILSGDPLFFILTAYDNDLPIENIMRMYQEMLAGNQGKIEFGNLIQQERSSGRKINQAVYARWASE